MSIEAKIHTVDGTSSDAELLRDLAQQIESAIYRDADQHYNNVIFRPEHFGQTPFDRYAKMYASDELALIARARSRADELEGQTDT